MMLEKEILAQAVNDHSSTPYNAPTSDFKEVRGRVSVAAFFLGMAMIAISILLGRSYVFFSFFGAFSILMTLLWRNAHRPLVFLTSISASIPITVSNQNIACNLLFALWFAAFNIKYIFRLPKWIYVSFGLAVIGLFTSSINWTTIGIVKGLLRQGTYFFTFFGGPFLLLPVLYLRMSDSRDHVANLQGLLFCLIVPSTVILISAKLFGSVANAWEASLHVAASAEGYLKYQFGNVIINFTRTGIGFILAALICASTAVTISQVKVRYRLLAGACLVSNVFLLLATGSFGSIFSCFCGLGAMFYTQFRVISITKVLLAVPILCCTLLLVYSLSPPSTKVYLGKRYEHRIVDADTDRLALWTRAFDYFLEHPEGIGLTLTVGDLVKSNPHNDYLSYIVSYGAVGGTAYPFLVTGVLIFFIRSGKRISRDSSAFAITLAGKGVIVALALNSMTDNISSNRWFFNAIWSLIWYCYFCSQAAQKSKFKRNKR